MLNTLSLSNFLLVEKTTITFNAGISVLTGETGAGKSILINALSLVLGSRGTNSWIGRYGDQAIIIAEFNNDNPEIAKDLRSLGINSSQTIILQRILCTNSQTKAFINNTPVPIKTLRLIGEQLVDIYGQHSHYALLKSDTQREKLDSFGDYQNELKQLKDEFFKWSDLTERYKSITNNQQTYQSRLELLSYQLEEFNKLDIKNNEFSELELLQKQLSRASLITEQLNITIEQLYSSDNSAISAIEFNQQNIAKYIDAYPELNNISEILEENSIQLNDVIRDIRIMVNKIESNPELLAETEERISKLFDLSRKHQCKPDELLNIQQKLQSELDSIQSNNQSLGTLKQDIETSRLELQKYANLISPKRQQFADKLSTLVTNQIQSLGMLGATFRIELHKLDDDKINQHGQEQVNFTIETNLDTGFNNLNTSASGGELSRLGLAIQVNSSNNPKISTLVMDEIDAGIGGETANKVGHLLKQLAQKAQIICVTHLPQIASIGNFNIKVSKQIIDNNTCYFVKTLDQQQRIKEIARMLDGDNVTEQSLKHAEEILKNNSR